jgi:FAD synthase
MEIIDWPALSGGAAQNLMSTAVTIGVFDGLHLGHRLLIDKVVNSGLAPMVVTFAGDVSITQSPVTLASLPNPIFPPLLMPVSSRLALLEKFGIMHCALIDFSENFSRIEYREFLDVLRERGGMRRCVIGADFHCGYRREADARMVKDYNESRGVATEIVPPLVDGGLPVSSSRIRNALADGDVNLAERLLGRKMGIGLLLPRSLL